MKKYFLFDIDGTLTDTGPGIMGCIQETLQALGWPEQPEEFLRQFVGPPLEDSFRDFCAMDEAQTAKAVRLYREKYFSHGLYHSPLYPGVGAMLERLSGRATLCVATSKNEPGAKKILAMRDIEKYFQVVVGDDGTRPSKAHVIAEALARLGSPSKAEVLMVGDRRYDVAGAKACGVETAGAAYGYGGRGELEAAGAEYLADSVEELEKLCLRLAGMP